jgi:hypothetical protein
VIRSCIGRWLFYGLIGLTMLAVLANQDAEFLVRFGVISPR